MLSLTHACPKCSARFIPWRVWAISRWSCIACPSCGARLNRSLDWRFAVPLVVELTALQVGALILVPSTSWPRWGLGLVVFLLAFWLADIATVQLIATKKRRGIRGYQA